MYPPHPWKEIGSLAVDLIGNLLQVSKKKISFIFFKRKYLVKINPILHGLGLKKSLAKGGQKKPPPTPPLGKCYFGGRVE